MTARREASAPPALPGYEHVRTLGLGGFADVFLYRQDLPRREVAVKVLLAGSLDDESRASFQTEANLMAQLSHHPSILTVYQASIAADGRPYLVMEYCSRPGLGERYRTERMSVAEVLRIGVRLSSAVETAHRAGILHRDIKPANVLTTDFGWPALTDFGIAATTGGAAGGAAAGMSIPWAPPELLADRPRGDERSDVYSLAATLYSLLAGRTPFEVPGAQNGVQQLVARIERSPLAPVGRQDVPPALQAVLERAMAKAPTVRYASAAAFGRALQQVEVDLLLPVTPLDLPDEPAAAAEDASSAAADDATRLRPILEVASNAPMIAEADIATRLRGPVTVAPAARPGYVSPPPPPPAPAPLGAPDHDESAPRGNSRVVAIVSGVVVLGAIVAVAVATLNPGARKAPRSEYEPDTDLAVHEVVPAPRSIHGERAADGSVVFTWTNPEPQAGDAYLWGVVDKTGQVQPERVEQPSATVPSDEAPGEVCVEVDVVRADGRVSDTPARGCAG